MNLDEKLVDGAWYLSAEGGCGSREAEDGFWGLSGWMEGLRMVDGASVLKVGSMGLAKPSAAQRRHTMSKHNLHSPLCFASCNLSCDSLSAPPFYDGP